MVDIRIAGENALIVYFGDRASPEVSNQIQAAAAEIRSQLGNRLVELIPSYASVLLLFDPLAATHDDIRTEIETCCAQLSSNKPTTGKLVELPVCYASEFAPDLERIAEQAKLSVEQVISIHCGADYHCYAIGFAPGFAYLGEVDERIALARMATPRLSVPRGSVGIANRQTAVYPADSPGGWNLIGRCPLQMSDHHQKSGDDVSMPVQVGDKVRFIPISRDDYDRLESPA